MGNASADPTWATRTKRLLCAGFGLAAGVYTPPCALSDLVHREEVQWRPSSSISELRVAFEPITRQGQLAIIRGRILAKESSSPEAKLHLLLRQQNIQLAYQAHFINPPNVEYFWKVPADSSMFFAVVPRESLPLNVSDVGVVLEEPGRTSMGFANYWQIQETTAGKGIVKDGDKQ